MAKIVKLKERAEMSKSEYEITLLQKFTTNKAVELMVHHLSLAAAFFEATHDKADYDYANMVIKEKLGDSPAAEAAHAWLSEILYIHDEMDQ